MLSIHSVETDQPAQKTLYDGRFRLYRCAAATTAGATTAALPAGCSADARDTGEPKPDSAPGAPKGGSSPAPGRQARQHWVSEIHGSASGAGLLRSTIRETLPGCFSAAEASVAMHLPAKCAANATKRACWVAVHGDKCRGEQVVVPFPRVARDAGIASTRAGRGLLRGSCGSRPPLFAAAASATLTAVPAPVHRNIFLRQAPEKSLQTEVSRCRGLQSCIQPC